ncbi:MAG: hypothetical protein DME26_04540 [Verrucomicrobia bacterium]|nr:MAG: hypothetical protein DME26_04540 [Verrucomicrobiota bacterium]
MLRLQPAIGALLIALSGAATAATVTIDGGVTNQFIDGFGVNANYWRFNNDELWPVFDKWDDAVSRGLQQRLGGVERQR